MATNADIDDARPPIRTVTTLLAEMQTSIVAAGLHAFDGDLDRFVIFTLIVRQSFPRRDPMSPPGQGVIDRAISINSLAASLGRSFETVRRHVNALVAQHLCERIAGGMIVVDTALDLVDVSEAIVAAHDAFTRMVEDMATLGLPLPVQRSDLPYRNEIGLHAAVDIMLAVVGTNIAVHREWLDLVLYSTVLCANVRFLARRRLTARAHGDESDTASAERLTPVSAGAIARALGLPESTVRRRVAGLVADGRIERSQGGLIASEAWLNRPESVAVSQASWTEIRRILARAAGEGFPFDNPATAYMRGRPPTLALVN